MGLLDEIKAEYDANPIVEELRHSLGAVRNGWESAGHPDAHPNDVQYEHMIPVYEEVLDLYESGRSMSVQEARERMYAAATPGAKSAWRRVEATLGRY